MYNSPGSKYNPEWDYRLLARLARSVVDPTECLDPREVEQVLIAAQTVRWPMHESDTVEMRCVGETESGKAIQIDYSVRPSGRICVKDVCMIPKDTLKAIRSLKSDTSH